MCPPSTNKFQIYNLPISFDDEILTETLTTVPMTKQQPKSIDKTKKLLPLDFEPTENSVICGNKRQFFHSPGNRRFRLLCKKFLEEYKNALSKFEKSAVVMKVMNMIREACPVGGAFVAFERGLWWEVSDRTAREKVGTFFRDCLADAYKSSSKNKIAQRRFKRKNSNNSSSSQNSSCCSSSSTTSSQNNQNCCFQNPFPVFSDPVVSTTNTITFDALPTVVSPVPAPRRSISDEYTSFAQQSLITSMGTIVSDESTLLFPESLLMSVGAIADDDCLSCSSTFYDVDDLNRVTL